jgi:hypothetical protein
MQPIVDAGLEGAILLPGTEPETQSTKRGPVEQRLRDRRDLRSFALLELLQDRFLRPPAPGPTSLRPLGRLGSPVHAGDERTDPAVLRDVLLDVDRDDLGLVHLDVQELDDAPQFRRDLVRNEHEPQPSGGEVRLHALPELVGIVAVVERGRHRRVRILTARLEPLAQLVGGPARRRIRRIVEQLPHHLAADRGVRAAFDLDERGDARAVQEQMVEPSGAESLALVEQRHLAPHEQPPRAGRRVAVVGQELRMLGEQLLQNRLGFVRLVAHRDEVVVLAQVDVPHAARLPRTRFDTPTIGARWPAL